MKEIIINPKDNVSVALEDGTVPRGHKIALQAIKRGEYVIKYGAPIGKATCDIIAGEWVHTHNLRTALEECREFMYTPCPSKQLAASEAVFLGYPTANGVGIRKHVYIIPTVGCVNSVCKRLAELANKDNNGRVDGVFALTHQFGCSQLGEDAEKLTALLCGLARNPNAAFTLFVGLGCENNALSGIQTALKPYDKGQFAFFNCQSVTDEIEYGAKLLRGFLEKAASIKRKQYPLSKLTVGLKCGGSDGLSGITANPLVGKVCDSLTKAGASAILTEIPECFGAEQTLLSRCADKTVYDKLLELINQYKDGYRAANLPIYENPSPGNKEGGITTLEEKSLGCVLKGGTATVTDVLAYGEVRQNCGLSVLSAPGNDMVAATALAAAGCNLLLFTTGRGTPLSTCIPTLKIASNAQLAERKANWIDFCAETQGEKALLELLLQTANGVYFSKTEASADIAFYKRGVTL